MSLHTFCDSLLDKPSFLELLQTVESCPDHELQYVMMLQHVEDSHPSPPHLANLKLPYLEQEPDQLSSEQFSLSTLGGQITNYNPLEFSLTPDAQPDLTRSNTNDHFAPMTTVSSKEAWPSQRCLQVPAQSKPSFISSNPSPKTPASKLHPLIVEAQKSKKIRSSDVKTEEKSPRLTHIAVERTRRKQMNEHLAILRSLMPASYVKRNDQASIIGGVIEFVKELHQLLQTLEGQKQRRSYVDALSPRPSPSPRPSCWSPAHSPTMKPSLSSPSSRHTFLSSSPKTKFPSHSPKSDATKTSLEPITNHLEAKSKSSLAEVIVKIAGTNVLLKTVSPRASGQLERLIMALESHSLEIIHLNITTVEETVLYSLTLKIGIECRVGVDDLAQEVHEIFRKIHEAADASRQ